MGGWFLDARRAEIAGREPPQLLETHCSLRGLFPSTPGGLKRAHGSSWPYPLNACFVEVTHAVVEFGGEAEERKGERGPTGFAESEPEVE